MANTTGSTLFNLDFTEIAEEAFERAGREMRTGYDLRTARRSMNLMTIEWANRGLNMWTIEPGTITLQTGLNTYPLPVDTIDLLEQVIRTQANQSSQQADLNITRISVSTYATIPNKLNQGRPIQVWIQRYTGLTNPTGATLATSIGTSDTTIELTSTDGLPAFGYINLGIETIFYSYFSGNTLYNCFRAQNNTVVAPHASGTPVYWNQLPAITVWPTPDASTTYTFAYWRMRRIQDAGAGVEVGDMNFRFLPVLVAGLAYYVAMKIPELQGRLDMLKAAYDEQFNLAAGEDQERAALRFVPRQQFIGGSTP